MRTVPDGVKIIIERSRYLSEALSKKLINHTALAEYIRPELEQLVFKKVSTGAIVMAIRRLESDLTPKYSKSILFKSAPEMLVRSGLTLTIVQRTKESEDAIRNLFVNRVKGTFHSITIGSSEIVIAVSSSLTPEIAHHIGEKLYISQIPNCALITIYLSQNISDTPGVYYFFLKSLAWEGINILQCASTSREFTLFFEEKNVHRGFEILSSLFEKSQDQAM